MPKKRSKKSTNGRVCVSGATMTRLISLGAAHHATLKKLQETARPVKPKKKAAKKSAKKASKRSKKARRKARK